MERVIRKKKRSTSYQAFPLAVRTQCLNLTYFLSFLKHVLCHQVLLSKMVPAGLLEYLKMPQLSAAESENLDLLEADQSEFSSYSGGASPSPSSAGGAGEAAAGGGGGDGVDGVPKKGLGAMGRLKERIAAHAAEAHSAGTAPLYTENFRIFFHTITQDHKLPDLIWNQQTRRELRCQRKREREKTRERDFKSVM
jgi:hypothetical protein